MTEEIFHRTMQVFLYTGGFVAFWQITKHMPKALYTTLECISVMALTVLCITPIALILEYILGGNVDLSMMFTGCFASVGLLSGIWMVMVQSSRELQGKKQYQYVIL
jgi:ABC-type thiamin/hydroxymethylpyrimidine transport system permease subunit